jgi:hypothetical protein
VLRGNDALSFSSWVFKVVRADERGEGGGGVESPFSEVPGTGSGSTGAFGPFPTYQLYSNYQELLRTSLQGSEIHQTSENKIMLLNLFNH